MGAARSAAAAGIAALLMALLASPSAAQDRARDGAPIVRVYSGNGPGVVSNYVTPSIEVSEDAYVFAVSMDLDGQIQILHPDFPGISVRIREHQQLRLPNFFAGFSSPDGGALDASGHYVSYSNYAGDENDSRGTVIALASRVPFNLERVESDGDWNISGIRRLIEHRTPASAAQALASYLGANGEPIGRDYMRFASAHRYNYASYALGALSSCDLSYGVDLWHLGFRRLEVLDRVSRAQRAGKRVSILGYDFCGMPIVAYGPSRTPTRSIPRSGPHGGNVPGSAVLGYFPITRRAEPSQSGDATVTAPNERRRDPRQIPIDRRIDPRGGALPGTTGIPLDPTPPRHTQPAATGVFPSHEDSRPVIREAPPPRAEPRPEPRSSPPPPPPPQTHSEPRSIPAPPPAPPPKQ
jgi:hypothetical protein